MKIVIAVDSFKGSMSSLQAGESAGRGVSRVFGDADIIIRPLADGGEGTVDALTLGCGGRLQKSRVTGPLGKKVSCQYGIVEESKTAIIEMSAAAGITLIDENERNPLNTTTYGVGEMIKDAIKKGCRNFLIGIGGSATNDGGAGMLQALGFDFLDKDGNQVPYGAKGLEVLEEINDDNILPELSECSFQIACDVTNTLCGEKGCSAIYGPQKGATPTMIMQMDKWLAYYAKLAKEKYPDADARYPGAGAAGGLGFAFMTFLNGKLCPGVDIVLRETRLEEYIRDADMVITGEGRLDGQTVMGKAPAGVAKIAKKYNIPVLAFAGCLKEDAILCNENGIDAFFPILRNVVSYEDAMKVQNAMNNMEAAVEQTMRLIKAVRKE